MKIVMWSDVHVEHSTSRSDNIRGERQSLLVMDVLEELALEGGRPDVILVNGDFFDAFGRIESSQAVEVLERVERLLARGIIIIFVTGNHEYPDVEEEFFGKGILTALFGGKEDKGLYVIDEVARFIRIDESHVVLGLPYRESYEQFEKSCLSPIMAGLERGEADPKKDKIIVGWHVGLPFGNAWRGDEDENAWINADNDAVGLLFDLAWDRRIYLGHYHGPDDVAFVTKEGKHIGVGTYIGSPSTRSRAESGQDKRVGTWLDGKVTFQSTHLAIDTVVASVEAAVAHLADMIDRFGEDVLQIATVHVDLGEDASMDDFHVARSKAALYPGDINVIRPRIVKKGLVEHIVEKYKESGGGTREQMELEIFGFSIRHHFKNASFKGLSDLAISAMSNVGYQTWKKAAAAAAKNDQGAEVFKNIRAAFLAAGVSELSQPVLTPEFCAQAASLAKTEELARQIALTV